MKCQFLFFGTAVALFASSAFATYSQDFKPSRLERLVQEAEADLAIRNNPQVRDELHRILSEITYNSNSLVGESRLASVGGSTVAYDHYGCGMIDASVGVIMGLRGSAALCTNFRETRFIYGFPVERSLGGHVGAGVFYLYSIGRLTPGTYECSRLNAALLAGFGAADCYLHTTKDGFRPRKRKFFGFGGLEFGLGATSGFRTTLYVY